MKHACPTIRDLLVQQMLGLSAEADRRRIEEHLRDCLECGQYRQSLEEQEATMERFSQAMEPVIQSGAEKTVAALLGSSAVPARRMNFRVPFYCAAAALVIGTLAVLLWPAGRDAREKPPVAGGGTGIVETAPPTVDPSARELALVRQMAEYRDTQALAHALRGVKHESARQAAALALAQFGDRTAIEPLEELAETWQGDRQANPYRQAVEAIKERHAPPPPEETAPATVQEKPAPEPAEAAAAKAAAPALRHPDWPGLDEEVTSFHMVTQYQHADGTTKTGSVWIRLPDKVRDEGTSEDMALIDNGIERLTLNRKTKEAQIGDSWTALDPPIWMHQQPLTDHPAFGYIHLFRDPNYPGEQVLTPLEEQSTEQVLVYDVLDKEMENYESIRLTAWVDARTRLPEKIEYKALGDPNQFDNILSCTVTFDFSPIADKVFSTRVPDGYAAPTVKECVSFTGYVVDQAGQAVTGAEVYLNNNELPQEKTLQTVSDETGAFEILLPPNSSGIHYPPIVFWAKLPNQPEWIGWTMLRSEKDIREKELGGPVPGNPGTLLIGKDYFYEEIENGYRTGGTWCVGARDIVLVMEPAARVFGTVTDVEGVPVCNAAVQVGFSPSDPYGNQDYSDFEFWRSTAVTNEAGYYEAGYLPRLWKACPFSVRASAEGLITETQSFRTEGALESKQVDLRMHFSGPTVTGVLKDNYGRPLAERSIYVVVGNKRYWRQMTETDGEGRFVLEGCPDDPELKIRAELSHNHTPPHETENYKNYVFYPDVIVPVDYEPGRMEYEVEMVAVLPEIVIDVEVVDSAGNPIPDFPVEIRGEKPDISSTWASQRLLEQRTDAGGFIRFTQVPDIEGLHLVFWGGADCWTDFRQTKEEQRRLDEVQKEYEKYKWLEIPLEVLPGQKEYFVRGVVYTREEAEQQP